MLPARYRMRSSGDFVRTVKEGVRAGRPTVVVHARRCSTSTKVGFVVSKKVGNAVTRNRVKRRMRHLVIEQLPVDGVDIVVRALPCAATHPERLAGDFGDAWAAGLRKLGGGS